MAPTSRIASSPSTAPSRKSPPQLCIASELDSWLFPPGPLNPPAYECPAQTSKVRRRGKRLSARSQFRILLRDHLEHGPEGLRKLGVIHAEKGRRAGDIRTKKRPANSAVKKLRNILRSLVPQGLLNRYRQRKKDQVRRGLAQKRTGRNHREGPIGTGITPCRHPIRRYGIGRLHSVMSKIGYLENGPATLVDPLFRSDRPIRKPVDAHLAECLVPDRIRTAKSGV